MMKDSSPWHEGVDLPSLPEDKRDTLGDDPIIQLGKLYAFKYMSLKFMEGKLTIREMIEFLEDLERI